MEIHPSIPMTVQYGLNGTAVIPVESFIARTPELGTSGVRGLSVDGLSSKDIDSSAHNRCNHLKHLGVPLVIALMYIPNKQSQINSIADFENKMSIEIPNTFNNKAVSSPYVEIIDQEIAEYPSEHNLSHTMQHIPDDIYDKLLNSVLYSQINDNSVDNDSADSEDPRPKKRSRKKRVSKD